MATISLLPVSLALVSIPRSRLADLSHPVLHQLLQPSPTFLNVTANALELTIFAEHHMLQHFEPIARKDRQKLRSRRKSLSRYSYEPIDIAYESWSVLQIDSHNDEMGNSGARVNELSAPLAEAGISILYQSSYMSDFIFVKEARLQEVMRLFEVAGFDLYSAEANILSGGSTSPPHSPLVDDRSSIAESTGLGTVLTRSRSSTDPPTPATDRQELESQSSSGVSPSRKSKSRSATCGQVDVLVPDLTCLGLSDENVEHWSLKIVKLVAFPDLIPSSPAMDPNDLSPYAYTPRPRQSDNLLTSRSPSNSPVRPGSPGSEGHSSSSFSSSDEDGYFSHSPSGNLSSSSLVTSAASKSFTDLSKLSGTKTHRDSISEGSISSHSSLSSSHFKPSKHLIQPMSPITTPPTMPIPHPLLAQADEGSSTTTITPTPSPNQTPAAEVPQKSPVCPSLITRGGLAPKIPSYKVPFFSFTRTSEGSSLTTSTQLLATLFPPAERYMVICGGELDDVDARTAARAQKRGSYQQSIEEDPLDDEEDEDSSDHDSSKLKCLQIDLTKYGLDKHGLVHRFSRVLEENGINHMYSATFKTANLLVDKKHARRAQRLLRNC